MNRIAEENSARRNQSFDTVLPDDVRARFTRPQRPRIPGRLEFPDRNILWLAGAIVFGAMLVALAIGLPGRHETHISTALEAIPGALIGMALVYLEGMRRGEFQETPGIGVG